MKLTSKSFSDGQAIPPQYAFGKHHPTEHFQLSDNKNPHLAWSDLPEGTQSLALICHDPDVPSIPDKVNKEGMTVPADLPRVDFFHWVLIDLDPANSELEEGEFSDGVTPKGKQAARGPRNTRQGLNNYTNWFEGDADMGGNYFGYDGPAPPWNDEIVHHYAFTLYALSKPTLEVPDPFTASDVLKAMEGHVLDKATLTGTYAINPDAR